MPLVPVRYFLESAFTCCEHYIKLFNLFKPSIFFAFAFLTCKMRNFYQMASKFILVIDTLYQIGLKMKPH